MSRHRRWFALFSLVFVLCASLAISPGVAFASGTGPSDVAPGPKLNGPAHHYKTKKVNPYCVTNPDGTCHQSCPVAPSAYNCDGLDPIQSGCTNYNTTEQIGPTNYVTWSSNAPQAQMEQRYNTYCQTRWTRVTPPAGTTVCLWIDVERQVNYDDEPWPDQPTKNNPNTYDNYACFNTNAWTNMVYAPWPSPSYSPYNSQPYVESGAGAQYVAQTWSEPI